MMPAAFVQIERVPLTPNGKVDWRALPSPEREQAQLAEERIAAANVMEEMVAGIWAEVLKVERVGTRDNFFDLGGHSLLAIQLVSRLNREFKIKIPLRLIFELPTVAEQASMIETTMRAERNLEELPLQPALAAGEIPLSFAQQRLWLLAQLEPDSLAYNIFKAIRLRGQLNVPALERSLQEIVRRHEALRTTVAMRDRKLVQVIAPPQTFDLPLIDLGGLAAADEREAEARRLIAEEAQRRFDLRRGPLLAARLLRLREDEHVFLLTLHHLISDGWSLGLFVNEMAILYENFSQGKGSPLAELPIQYKDFAVWQREWLQGEVLERELSYWKEQLAGAPPEITLPTDERRQAGAQSSRGATRTLLLDESLARGLKTLSRQQGATIYMIMLATMKALLFKWTGQSDLVIGTVVANRNRFEAEQLIGCFINFLPVRSRLSDDQTGLELLRQVKTTTLEACSYQDCPFDKIVEAVNPEKRLSRSPIYNVAFFMQNTPFLQNPRLGETLELTVESEETDSAPLDLRFIAYELSDSVVLKCEYSTDLFEDRTMEHLVASYVQMLAELIANPSIKLSELKVSDALAAQAERARARHERQTIAVAATFTAEPVEASIAFWMEKLGLASRLLFAPYNQVFQQLLDPSSLLSLNRNGINVILVRFEDWHRFADQQPAPSDSSGAEAKVREAVEQLLRALKSAVERSALPFIVCLCPDSPALAADQHRAAFNRQMEELVASGLKTLSDVYVMTSAELLAAYPVASYHNAHGDELGHVPYTQAFFTALGSSIARKINAIRSAPYKVIVLDCDQTLWKGVCGEDGAHGIEIDEAHRFLQEFIVSQ
jgi:acyl carrier protein